MDVKRYIYTNKYLILYKLLPTILFSLLARKADDNNWIISVPFLWFYSSIIVDLIAYKNRFKIWKDIDADFSRWKMTSQGASEYARKSPLVRLARAVISFCIAAVLCLAANPESGEIFTGIIIIAPFIYLITFVPYLTVAQWFSKEVPTFKNTGSFETLFDRDIKFYGSWSAYQERVNGTR